MEGDDGLGVSNGKLKKESQPPISKTSKAEAASKLSSDPKAKISTAGPTPCTSFKACRPRLSEEVIEVVTKMGFESMTPVQVSWNSPFITQMATVLAIADDFCSAMNL